MLTPLTQHLVLCEKLVLPLSYGRSRVYWSKLSPHKLEWSCLLILLCFALFVCLFFFNFNWKQSVLIDHFHVNPNLSFMARLSAKSSVWKWFFIVTRIKQIFTRTVLQLALFWKWQVLKLGNGLFSWVLPIRVPFKRVFCNCHEFFEPLRHPLSISGNSEIVC